MSTCAPYCASERLFASISVQADDEKLKQALGLEDSFRTTHALLALHVWMCLVRLRQEARLLNRL